MPRVAPVTRARRSARRRELLMVSALTLRQPWCQEDPALNWGLLPFSRRRWAFWVLLCTDCTSKALQALVGRRKLGHFFAFHRACVPSGLRPVEQRSERPPRADIRWSS